jgi:uncharacterized damage-inducible protein DinB
MDLEDVRSLYDYDAWANARVLEAIGSLDPQEREAHVESSFPSVLATMGHIVAAEWVWLERWLGNSPSAFPEWLGDPSLEVLEARLSLVESARARFLAGLDDADLQSRVSYRTLSGDAYTNRLLDLLLHVVNHSTYHRGQLTTMFRQLGARPVPLDYVLFKRS